MTVSDTAPTSRLLTREFVLVVITASVYAVGIGSLNALVPPFVVDELDGSEATAGVVMGSAAVTALCSRAIWGRVGDRYGARRLVGVGAAIVGFSLLILLVWPTVAGVLTMRLVMGAGSAAFFVGTSLRSIELAPDNRRSQAAAFNLTAFHVGMGLGPFGGEWVLATWSYDVTWVVVAGLSFTGCALSWLLTAAPGDPDATPSPAVHRAAIGPAVVTLFGVFGFNGYLIFAALYADEIGLSAVGPVFMVSSGTMIVTRLLFGRLPDVIGPVRAGTGALLVTTGATTLMALWNEPVGLYVGAATLALGLSMQSPSFMVIAIDRVPERERASAMATYTASFDLASALSGPVLGVIAATSGFRAAFLVAAALSLVALALLRIRVAPHWSPLDNRPPG